MCGASVAEVWQLWGSGRGLPLKTRISTFDMKPEGLDVAWQEFTIMCAEAGHEGSHVCFSWSPDL